jgi:uncharacterized membrane protein
VLRDTSVSGESASLIRPLAGTPLLTLMVLSSNLLPQQIRQTFSGNLLEFTALDLVIMRGAAAALLTIFLNRTLKLATASYMAIMSTLTSIFVVILALVFLDERISLLQAGGGILIILSGTLAYRFKFEKQ